MGWWWMVACAPESTGTVVPDSGTTPTDETGTRSPLTLDAVCEPSANPLRFSCHLTVDPPQAVQVSFVTAGGEPRVHRSMATAAEHEIPLYFLRPETDYTWIAATVDSPLAPTITGVVRTGEVPLDVASELVVQGTSSVPYIGTHDPCATHPVAVVYDTVTGEIVWFSSVNTIGSFGFLNMVRYTEDHTILGETGSAVVEIDLTGQELFRLERGVDYEEDLHHDLNKKDGLYYLLFHEGLEPLLDGVIVFDVARQRLLTWRARDTLAIPADAVGDWMHTNSIIIDDGGYWYLSSFEQDTILKVNGDPSRETFGTPMWALAGGEPKGFGQDFTIDWAGIGDQSFADPHNIQLTAAGELVLLDNPNGRALAFTLDQKTKHATAIGEYPTAESTCGPQGTAFRSANGNTFAACSGSTLREYSSDGAPVWQGDVACGGGFTNAVRFYPLEGW